VSSGLDLVRGIYDSWSTGDFAGTDWADPAIEFHLHVTVEGGGQTAHGLSEMLAIWRQYLRAWAGYRVETESFHELDDGRVVVLVRGFGRGRASGIDLERIGAKGINVFSVRDGLVRRLDVYGGDDWQAMLADIGIELPPR
jgi:ketosteroid isomerase-like protein